MLGTAQINNNGGNMYSRLSNSSKSNMEVSPLHKNYSSIPSETMERSTDLESSGNTTPYDIGPFDEIPEDGEEDETITNCLWLLQYKIEFPLFTDKIIKEYEQFNHENINPFIFLPIIILYYTLVACSTGLMGLRFDGAANHNVLVFSLFLIVLFTFIFGLYVLMHFLRLTERKVLHDGLKKIFEEWLPIPIEEIMLLFAIFMWSLFLISRVVKGQCPPGTTLFQQQTCNQFASMGGIPNDMAYSLYFSPLVLQSVTRNLSIRMLVLSNLSNLLVVTFCVIYSGAWSDYCVILNWVFFVTFAFAIEQLQRIAYAALMKAKDQQDLAIKRMMHEQAMLKVMTTQQLKLERAADEKKMKEQEAAQLRSLKETEVAQLRSLMGNVAHDLKTPLFAIEADLETLKLFFNCLSDEDVRIIIGRMWLDRGDRDAKDMSTEDELEPRVIFESLWATIRFMVAAINRGQDYMKATNNVALVPANATFQLANTLSMAARCVRSIMPIGRHLHIHPLPLDLSNHPKVIGDSHWLLENVLCLVSNAIKYSDSGDIDLHIHITSTEDSMVNHEGQPIGHLNGSQKSIQSLRSQSEKNDQNNMNSHTITNATINITTNNTISKKTNSTRSIGYDRMLVVTIEDHGVGVPDEMRETLFQPFRQAQRMTGGTGLGLYSLYKRVEALGGDCGVMGRSDGQPGSAFWFSFPYRPDDTENEEDMIVISRNVTPIVSPRVSPRASPRPSIILGGDYENIMSTRSGRGSDREEDVPTSSSLSSIFPYRGVTSGDDLTGESRRSSIYDSASSSRRVSATGFPCLKILLTDDAPTILKVVGRLLRSNGHSIETSMNGYQSLEKLKIYYTNNESDVLLTDLQMPVMDGIECTKRFRVWEETQQCLLDAQGLPRRPRFLIVGMSANSDAQSRQEVLEAGMDYFIPKPFNYTDFEAVIRAHARGLSTVPTATM